MQLIGCGKIIKRFEFKSEEMQSVASNLYVYSDSQQEGSTCSKNCYLHCAGGAALTQKNLCDREVLFQCKDFDQLLIHYISSGLAKPPQQLASCCFTRIEAY